MCKATFGKSYDLSEAKVEFEAARDVYSQLKPFGDSKAWKTSTAVLEFVSNLAEHTHVTCVSVTLTEKDTGARSVVLTYKDTNGEKVRELISKTQALPEFESSRGRGLNIMQELCNLNICNVGGVVALEMSPRG